MLTPSSDAEWWWSWGRYRGSSAALQGLSLVGSRRCLHTRTPPFRHVISRLHLDHCSGRGSALPRELNSNDKFFDLD
jgi:hypothetical protein